MRESDEGPASTGTLSAATLLGSLFALATCEVLRAERVDRAPLANTPSFFDYGQVALGAFFMTLAFGALVLALRLLSRRSTRALGGVFAAWLGPRLGPLAIRSWIEIGVPVVFLGWFLMTGTRAWTSNVTIWLLIAVALLGGIPVVWALDHVVHALEVAARGRRRLVFPVALACAVAGALGWSALTASFGWRYGKSHLVTFALLVTWLSMVFSEALRVSKARTFGRGWGALWLGAVLVSGTAFFTTPSAAARELFYAERPTRWFALSLAELGPDADGDGFERPLGFTAGQDCDDHAPERNPREPEIVGNGIDDNCFAGDQTRSFRELFAEPPVARETAEPVANVLVLLLDSWRFDQKTATGIDRELTPTIAALAEESLVFSDYRTCSPRTRESFGDLFFGRLVPTYRGSRPASAVERLTAAGVHTVDISSRFRHEHDRVSGWWKEISIPGSYGNFDDARAVLETQGTLRKGLPHPFFVATHLLGAHEPYEPLGACAGDREPYARYRCALRLLDQRVGDVLRTVKDAGLLERTVIVVSADHGEEFGEHGARFHANTVYDEILRVPLLVRPPRGKGELVREPVGCFDFMPTLLGAAGYAPDPLLIGHDFSRGPRPAGRPQLARTRPLDARGLFEPKSIAVVLERTKLVVDRQSGLAQYFDLHADPAEQKPLARVRPTTQHALVETMDAWLSELARQSLPDERTASSNR